MGLGAGIALSLIAGVSAFLVGCYAFNTIRDSKGRLKGTGTALTGILLGLFSITLWALSFSTDREMADDAQKHLGQHPVLVERLGSSQRSRIAAGFALRAARP